MRNLLSARAETFSGKRATSLLATFFIVLGCGFMLATNLFAANPPSTIGYQGYLTSATGTAQTGTSTMIVRIYDSATGGNLLFEEDAGAIPVASGYFFIPIGAVGDVSATTTAVAISDLQFNEPYYVTVEIGAPFSTGEMLLAGGTRSPMNSVPYSSTAYGVFATSTNTGLVTAKGKLYYDTATDQVMVYTGSTWQPLVMNSSNGLTIASGTITLLNSTNATTTNLFAGNATTTNLAGTNSVITNSTSTNSFSTNASSTNATSSNFFAGNGVITNATSTNLFSTLLSAITAIFTNLTATNATTTNLVATNATTTNTSVVTGTSTLATTTVSNLIAASGTVTLLNATNATATNFVATNASTTNSTSTTGFFSSLLTALTAAFTNLTSTNATTTNATSTNFFTTNASSTNATSSNFFAINGTINNATTTNLGGTNSIITNATSTNFFTTNASSTNATSTNFFAINGTINNATTTNLGGTNSVITNSTSTNSFSTNASSTNATSSNFFAGNAVITNATTTSLFSTILSAITAIFTNLTATNATTTNLSSTNATSTNFFTTNASSTNATSSNLFAQNATTTNLSATNGNITNATTSSLAISGLTQGSVPFIGVGGAINENNGNLFWNNTNTRLSIGTSSPQARLSVLGSIGASTVLFDVASTTSSTGATSSLFTVLANGNVGVGTSSPTANFEIYNTSAGPSSLLKITQRDNTANFADFYLDDTLAFDFSFDGITTKNANMFMYANGVARITLDTDANSFFNGGNVGIGTSSPNALLSVSSTTLAATSELFSVSAESPIFTVLANGRVGIGTSTPTDKLQVLGNITPGTDLGGSLGSSTLRFLNLFSQNIFATSGVVTNSSSTNIFGTSGSFTNGVFNNATTTALSFTNATGSIFSFTNATGSSLFSTSGSFTNGVFNNATTTALSFTNATGTTFFFTSGTTTNIFGTSGSFTNLVSINATTTALSFTNGTGTVLALTSATTTNLFSTLGSFTNGVFINATTTSFSSTNSTSTNFFTTNASSTNATSSNFFAQNATTTNFSATNGNITNATTSSLAISGLTQGSVPFIGVGGALNQNNANLFWNNTNTRLSIGTSSPQARLSVLGAIGASTVLFDVASTTSSAGATSSLFTVLANGNVGVGTSSPAFKLDVANGGGRFGGSVLSQGLVLSNNGSSAFSTINSYNGLSGYVNTIGGIGTGGTDSVLNASRISSSGNLINIGSIQAGQTILTKGGTLSPKVDYNTGTQPYSVVIVDVNGDGKNDLAVANNGGGGNISVLLNNGTGTFATKVDYDADGSPVSIANADFNGDGFQDLVTANQSGLTVSVFLNSATGTFPTRSDYTASGGGGNTLAVATGDVNGDGKSDIVTANGANDDISVLLNRGDGTFSPKTSYLTGGGSEPQSVALADINGDGRLDAVTADFQLGNVSILFNTGNGVFGTNVDYSTGGNNPYSVAVTDFNGDNKPDIAVTNRGTHNITVLLNSGTSTFPTIATYNTDPDLNPDVLAVGDINGDGKQDIATANFSSSTIGVFLNNGDGTFATIATTTTALDPTTVAIGDINGDGKPDLVATANGANKVSVLLNTPTTIFSALASSGLVGVGTSTGSATLTVQSGGANINPFIVASSSGTALFTVLASGTLQQTVALNCALSTNASGGIMCSSDERLKNISGVYGGGLTELQVINPIRFNYKNETYQHVGFSAQNVQAVLPEGAPLQGDGYLGLDSNAVLALTVNAIKDLNNKVNSIQDSMSADIVNISNQVNSISTRLSSLEEGQISTVHPLVMLRVENGGTGTISRFTNTTGYCDIDSRRGLVCTTDDNVRTNTTLVDTITPFATSTTVESSTASTSLEKISSLHVVTYTLENSSTTSTGIVLNEIKSLFPDLVVADTNGKETFSISNLIPYIIESIKQLTLAIADMKNLFVAKEIRATNVNAEEVCLGTGDSKTCITKQNLDSILLLQSAQSASAQENEPAPSTPDEVTTGSSSEILPPEATSSDSATTTEVLTDEPTSISDGNATTSEETSIGQ